MIKYNFIEYMKREIKEFYELEYGEDLLFVIYYGSWAWGLNSKESDLDVVAVCKKYNEKQLDETVYFIRSLHRKYGLKFDEEVPYKNKVVVNYQFAMNSLQGGGLDKDSKGLIIQPIVKTKEFLSSKKMAMRLFLNAMTTNNVFCGGNIEEFKIMKDTALKNSVRVFFSAWKLTQMNINEFVESLLSRHNKTGQYYLGFEDYPVVREYLIDNYTATFNSLVANNYLIKYKGNYVIANEKWFKEII